MLVRLEDAGIIGAGHETLHQRCVLGLMGTLGRAGALGGNDIAAIKSDLQRFKNSFKDIEQIKRMT